MQQVSSQENLRTSLNSGYSGVITSCSDNAAVHTVEEQVFRRNFCKELYKYSILDVLSHLLNYTALFSADGRHNLMSPSDYMPVDEHLLNGPTGHGDSTWAKVLFWLL